MEYSILGGVAHGYPRRRESLAKIHSMTVEAPITKVTASVSLLLSFDLSILIGHER